MYDQIVLCLFVPETLTRVAHGGRLARQWGGPNLKRFTCQMLASFSVLSFIVLSSSLQVPIPFGRLHRMTARWS